MGSIDQARRQVLSRAQALRCGSSNFSAICPALELVQPRADGLNRHPALKAVRRVGRPEETAVSGQRPAQFAIDEASRLS
jgi:hypothetical protein